MKRRRGMEIKYLLVGKYLITWDGDVGMTKGNPNTEMMKSVCIAV